MSETIAITGKSIKLFKGHYTRSPRISPGERGITGAPLKSFAFRVTR
ncbi:MAG: hypothetical protein ACREYE_31415 [Gammaproteobacteria bacterium]